ncbi:hypothetical protein AVEN_22576-1 [Araneus ventricosus]|uniref:Uncharacterized protein n=1 Tax=Araneus ventricosus TaxID=182803 RepID=A0A4Y2E8Z1_ARAVE|nr:hypothetical protein AVEN_22576-1 [Araneus ventricosus]
MVANNLPEESRHHPVILASKARYLLNSRKVENNRKTPPRTAHGPFRKAKDGKGEGRRLDPEIYKGVEIRKGSREECNKNRSGWWRKTLSGRCC